MTDIVFFLPAINPYWRDRFNALASSGRVSFHCVFSDYIDPMRSWTVDESTLQFPHTFLTTSKASPARYLELARLWWRLRPERVFTFHHVPALWPAWIHRATGRHLALYALMTWDSWVRRRWHKEILKRVFFRGASSVLTPGPDSDAYVESYGATNTHRLHHAVDWVALQQAGCQRQRSASLRLLYIGRLIPGKGVPFLLPMLDHVLRRDPSVSVELVGDGELWGEVEAWAARHGHDRVRVTAFVQSADVADVYARNDVLLFPTLGDPYGLVVDEALASGMPVISSDRAGDIRWRIGQSRGRVVPPEDKAAWMAAINEYSQNRDLLQAHSLDASAFSAGHGTERWVEEICRWVARTSNA
ncbi:glycosyltransferase [Microbacterium oryzae]|uniref:glycosyltransferase family 4 protein n=1 Tax=Microbacterium oryzae TaxID=743009 RepID=UPI0025AFAFCF|nr:glycosyltransferase [Microbacterium oryzae]MDN3311627.1 glycosyltransferase [Microbacterium oryzae]